MFHGFDNVRYFLGHLPNINFHYVNQPKRVKRYRATKQPQLLSKELAK